MICCRTQMSVPFRMQVNVFSGMQRPTSKPSALSTTNLCCSMTRSRSPGAYPMSDSRRVHSVSSKLPARGTSFSSEKSPIQRRPEIMRAASTGSENEQSSLTRSTRALQNKKEEKNQQGRGNKEPSYLSDAALAPEARFVASAHVMPSVTHSLGWASSQPSWMSVRINSGKP
jgi:hypothetical protein